MRFFNIAGPCLYLDRFRLDHGTLVIFDRREPDEPPVPERVSFTDARTPAGRPVRLLRA